MTDSDSDCGLRIADCGFSSVVQARGTAVLMLYLLGLRKDAREDKRLSSESSPIPSSNAGARQARTQPVRSILNSFFQIQTSRQPRSYCNLKDWSDGVMCPVL